MMELIREEQREAYLAYFNRSQKKFSQMRWILGIVLFLLFAIGVLILQKPMWLIGSPVAFFIGYKLPYLDLMLNKKKNDLLMSFLFPQFLQSFMALQSSSGNIYQTLKETVNYTNEPLKKELKKLVKRIEQDNNREAYIDFAKYIGSAEAYMIMDKIYQFSEFGVKADALRELQNYIQSIHENKTNELIDSRMTAMENLAIPPILISLFIVGSFAVVIFMYYMEDVMDAMNIFG
ncbi:flagellar assembly protein FlaJ [Virgibacillus sp. Bac330]|uniref:flagellar assembly protein FlaJ n=1 Tax=Virgibacillus sp. Bac330 TaxID=2419841 RepID=UPI000EF526D7|nr:flagellar assembly protein FlaJ [Virgibacillus sp. Bac330]